MEEVKDPGPGELRVKHSPCLHYMKDFLFIFLELSPASFQSSALAVVILQSVKNIQWKKFLRVPGKSFGSLKTKMLWLYWIQKSLTQGFKCEPFGSQETWLTLAHTKTWGRCLVLTYLWPKHKPQEAAKSELLTARCSSLLLQTGMCLKQQSNSR